MILLMVRLMLILTIKQICNYDQLDQPVTLQVMHDNVETSITYQHRTRVQIYVEEQQESKE